MLGHDKKIALVTTYYDYSRYISDNVHMINKGLDKPYSVKEFEEKFLFKPTKAAITLYKALYGDESDNIKGAIYLDKTKLVNNIKELCYNYIKEVADTNKTLEDVEKDLKQGRQFDIAHIGETPLEQLLFAFNMNSKQVNIIDRTMLNISIICSLLEGKDISKYIHSNPEKPEYNSVIRQSIFKVDTKSWFGKTK
jgi:5'-3' exonuclease